MGPGSEYNVEYRIPPDGSSIGEMLSILPFKTPFLPWYQRILKDFRRDRRHVILIE
jgi:hypothetical protein